MTDDDEKKVLKKLYKRNKSTKIKSSMISAIDFLFFGKFSYSAIICLQKFPKYNRKINHFMIIDNLPKDKKLTIIYFSGLINERIFFTLRVILKFLFHFLFKI